MKINHSILITRVLGVSLLGLLGGLIFTPTARAQCETQKLFASDATPSSFYGFSVSLDGMNLLVGSYFFSNRDIGFQTGAAYFLENQDGNWTSIQKITASDEVPALQFGLSVAIQGTTAAVLAGGDDTAGENHGAVYIFEKIGGDWVETQKLIPFDLTGNVGFYKSVVLDNNILVVDALFNAIDGTHASAAFVYEKIDGVWTDVSLLTVPIGQTLDLWYIFSIDVDNGTIAIGSIGAFHNSVRTGSVTLFEKIGGTWQTTSTIFAPDGQNRDYFGQSLSLDGNRILVSAPNEDSEFLNSGAAYIFEKTNGTWSFVNKLKASDPKEAIYWGLSVSIQGKHAVIGSRYDSEIDAISGSAYLFEQIAGTWVQQTKFLPRDSRWYHYFGRPVVVDNGTIVVGVHNDDDFRTQAGAVYVFVAEGLDADADGIPDACCVSAAPVQPVNFIATNRYFSFTTVEPKVIQAIRVTMANLPAPWDVLNGQSLWVGPPREVSEDPGKTDATPPTLLMATLQCDPYYADWNLLGTVHVFDETIIPNGSYDLQTVNDGCGTSTASNFSTSLSLNQARFGDTLTDFSMTSNGPPDGTVNMVDAVGILDKFRGLPSAISKVRADIMPAIPDRIITMFDVAASIDGFRSLPYSFAPSGVICP